MALGDENSLAGTTKAHKYTLHQLLTAVS